jgi:hypothetical protein
LQLLARDSLGALTITASHEGDDDTVFGFPELPNACPVVLAYPLRPLNSYPNDLWLASGVVPMRWV